jgi:hypothetical protein
MTSSFWETNPSKALQAYIEKRRLWEKVRAENPHYTEAEVEARLEQFGV